MFSPFVSYASTNDGTEYHELTDSELQAIYEEEEVKIRQQEELIAEVEKTFKEEWIYIDENGLYHLHIPEEELEYIDEDVLVFVKEGLNEKNELIQNGLLFEDEGELYITETAEDFVIQSAAINVVPQYTRVKIGFINFTLLTGFNVVANNYIYAIIMAVAGIVVDIIDFVSDISTLWKNNDMIAAFALQYSRSLHEIIRQMGDFFLSGVPSYLLLAIETAWNWIFVGAPGILLTVLNFAMPPATHSFAVMNHAINRRKGATFKYQLPALYKGYSLKY